MQTAVTHKRVFLTGASAGIGLATARALSAAGCEVWGTARDVNRLPSEKRIRFDKYLQRLDKKCCCYPLCNTVAKAWKQLATSG